MAMRVAFVGARRSPTDMPQGYWPTFVRYHLELPYYYARHAPIDVDLVHPESIPYEEDFSADGGGRIRCITEDEYRDDVRYSYDVVVHWRRWFHDLSDHLSRNVILSQDHSYSVEWVRDVNNAYTAGLLDGILVFPTWHRENMWRELSGNIPHSRLYEGMTLGVDTDVYRPGEKDPYHLLWASDPGRGLDRLVNPFLRLWKADRRFRLTVTYPDYVRPEALTPYASFLKHPGVTHLTGVRNGPGLWDLFARSTFLPYSSNFLEPSSRCHRQAMAAGSVVLYPPDMGTPSQLIETGLTGMVEPIETWPDVIQSMVRSRRHVEIGHNARQFALGEDWRVQARRFHSFFGG